MNVIGDSEQSQHESPAYSRRRVLESIGLLAFGTALSVAAPLQAHARKKKPKYYRIIYKLNGGKILSGKLERIRKNRSILASKLKIPKRTGYQFMGWYSDKQLTRKARKLIE